MKPDSAKTERDPIVMYAITTENFRDKKNDNAGGIAVMRCARKSTAMKNKTWPTRLWKPPGNERSNER